ncbi:hypothetical protein ABT093_29455 [Kitasatospora sp. NPDC002551]|uniref:hypothetical protein n=1 Tax=unclassified Kitasatospora TaxID=2633591 RepID=UPI003320CD1C
MGRPRIRLGDDVAWVELAEVEEESWRVTADWSSRLTADFTAYLTTEEVADFAARMLALLRTPSGEDFAERVTPGRNNPLTLRGEPVEDGYAFAVRLTPHGDDAVCQLQLEVDPVGNADLCELFEELRASLAVGR